MADLRRTGRPLTIAYIDLDDFKRVNDSLGHKAGDTLLRTVAQALRSRLRATDLLARVGGDEFGILLPDTDVDGARAILEKTNTALKEAVDGKWPVTQSVGVVTFLDTPHSFDDMIHLADQLMYDGKHAGRARIVQGVWTAEGGMEVTLPLGPARTPVAKSE